MLIRIALCFALAAPVGCAVQQPASTATPPIEVAFSPEAGAQALVLRVIGSARQSIRLAGYPASNFRSYASSAQTIRAFLFARATAATFLLRRFTTELIQLHASSFWLTL